MSRVYILTPQMMLLTAANEMQQEGPDRWTTGQCARDHMGNGVNYNQPIAVRYCALGRMAKMFGLPNAERAMTHFNKVAIAPLHWINDRFGLEATIRHMKLAATRH